MAFRAELCVMFVLTMIHCSAVSLRGTAARAEPNVSGSASPTSEEVMDETFLMQASVRLTRSGESDSEISDCAPVVQSLWTFGRDRFPWTVTLRSVMPMYKNSDSKGQTRTWTRLRLHTRAARHHAPTYTHPDTHTPWQGNEDQTHQIP